MGNYWYQLRLNSIIGSNTMELLDILAYVILTLAWFFIAAPLLLSLLDSGHSNYTKHLKLSLLAQAIVIALVAVLYPIIWAVEHLSK